MEQKQISEILNKLGKPWTQGRDLNRTPHEYLKAEDYYESGSVGTKARSSYSCEFCGKSISQGIPHATHKFYGDGGEWPTYRTHHECSDKFMNSLRKPEDEF